jgi:pimeloyl-ACP methyl ester carboxylesterase
MKLRKVLIGLVVLLLAVAAGFVLWAENPLGPAPEALSALQSDARVTVTTGDYIVFEPTGEQPATGLIFYPGGRVDARSYAPALRQIAAQGYLVVLVRAPLNLMVFAPGKAADVIPQFPAIQHWAIGGHSLGGAMAANFAYTHPGAVEGLVLWASYPAGSNDLSQAGVKVLSIYGSEDMAGMEPFEASRALLPADTTWVVIPGGNHAQFGDYGPQPGDNPASIDRASQQSQAVAATLEFLRSLAGQP